jgi:CubicO group peptidase (beta-lactamase class C family)
MLVLLALLAVPPAVAEEPALRSGLDASEFRALLDEKMPAWLADNLTPGAAVALVKDGKTAWIAGYGLADVESDRRVTADTAFNIGSISKTVAAWGVMKLVEDERIDLDAPIERYLTRWHLPESEFDLDSVTMRRLLSHTAGLRLHGYPGFLPTEELPSVEQSLSGATNGPGDVRVIMQPGSKWQYSGGGFTIAQLIVEEVTGENFAAFMEQEIFKPLGMTNSYYGWPERISRIAATPYDEMAQSIPGPRFTALAAAGLQTTASDMAKFVEASLQPKVLKEETVRLMQQPANDASPNYGLGYGVNRVGPNITVVGHGGSNAGWVADLGMIPASGDGLVVLTNASFGGNVNQLARGAWLGWLTGVTRPTRTAIGPVVISTTLREGVEAAVKRYRRLRKENAEQYFFGEHELNEAGYALLGKERMDDALALFELNVEMFPGAWNPWDSLGEANMKRGNFDRAIECYEKSLELNPENENGAEMLKKLRERDRSNSLQP